MRTVSSSGGETQESLCAAVRRQRAMCSTAMPPDRPAAGRGAGDDEEGQYDAWLTQTLIDSDVAEGWGFFTGSGVVLLLLTARGLLRRYWHVLFAWAVASVPSAALPGIAAVLFPGWYARPGRREAVVVLAKLLLSVAWLPFRLSWHAPGTPLDARAQFGWALLPVQPMALIQSGALTAMVLTVRHSLRFRAQLLCQLALLTALLQGEMEAHRIAADPRQNFVSLRLAVVIQVLLGAGLPLLHHYQYDKHRRQRWRCEEDQRQRRRQRQQPRRRRRPQAPWREELHED